MTAGSMAWWWSVVAERKRVEVFGEKVTRWLACSGCRGRRSGGANHRFREGPSGCYSGRNWAQRGVAPTNKAGPVGPARTGEGRLLFLERPERQVAVEGGDADFRVAAGEGAGDEFAVGGRRRSQRWSRVGVVGENRGRTQSLPVFSGCSLGTVRG